MTGSIKPPLRSTAPATMMMAARTTCADRLRAKGHEVEAQYPGPSRRVLPRDAAIERPGSSLPSASEEPDKLREALLVMQSITWGGERVNHRYEVTLTFLNVPAAAAFTNAIVNMVHPRVAPA